MLFGLAGAGNIGQVRAKALKGLKDSDLVAVSDVDLPLAKNLDLFVKTPRQPGARWG